MCRQTTISQCKPAKYCQLYLFYEVNPLLSTVLGIFCRGVQHTASPTFTPILMVAEVQCSNRVRLYYLDELWL
jgi:hypothetical protein